MTMFHKQFSENTNHFDCYGRFMGELGGYDCFGNKGDNNKESDKSRCDQDMAEQEDSRTESTTVNEAACSSSKDERDDGNWLQLGIGISTNQEVINKQDEDPNTRQTDLVELNLLPPENSDRNQVRPFVSDFEFRPPTIPNSNTLAPSGYQYGAGSGAGFTNYITATGMSVAPLFFQQGVRSSSSFLFPQHQDVNWAFRPVLPRNLLISSSSATSSPSSSFMPQGLSYTGQSSYQYLPQTREVDLAGPSFDFRIIDPPRRQHCGIWFMLQASQNQERPLILPQVPKSYMRIKDGRLTVRLLIKYLVNKLKLDNESEIEIRCKGERLQPHLTLQLVRDTIWNNTTTSSNTRSSTIGTDHIMILHYARNLATIT